MCAELHSQHRNNKRLPVRVAAFGTTRSFLNFWKFLADLQIIHLFCGGSAILILSICHCEDEICEREKKKAHSRLDRCFTARRVDCAFGHFFGSDRIF